MCDCTREEKINFEGFTQNGCYGNQPQSFEVVETFRSEDDFEDEDEFWPRRDWYYLLALVVVVVKQQHLDVARCCNECEGFGYLFLCLMFSRKNTLAASLMLYLDDVFDEEQVISIFSDLTRKNPAFPYWKCDKIVVQLEDLR